MSFIKQKELLLRSARIEAVEFYNKLQKKDNFPATAKRIQNGTGRINEVLAEFEKFQDENRESGRPNS